jgi:hypothetical protein
VKRPDVVAEGIPEAPDVAGARAGQARKARIAREELVILRDDAFDLCLLEHDLGYKDVIGIGGAPPRQVATMRGVPASQSLLKAPSD